MKAVIYKDGRVSTMDNVIEVHYRPDDRDEIAVECESEGCCIPLNLIHEIEVK